MCMCKGVTRLQCLGRLRKREANHGEIGGRRSPGTALCTQKGAMNRGVKILEETKWPLEPGTLSAAL